MGYRHQVISDTMVPSKEKLPEWFVEKYEEFIDFDGDYWASRGGYKRYGIFRSLEYDIQKVIAEVEHDRKVQLVFFADESIVQGHADVSHVTITADKITEIFLDGSEI